MLLCVAAEHFTDPPVLNRVGHQGLFYERFSTDANAPPGSDACMALPPGACGPAPGSTGLYYNRNRHYNPALGRFLQRDPNETALPLLSSLAQQGQAFAVSGGPFDAMGLFADGLNLFAYLRANPTSGVDPLGLFDWDAAVDDVISDIYANRAANAAELQEKISAGLNVAKLIGEFALQMLPGADAVKLMAKLYSGDDISFSDVAFAALDLGGGAIVGKLIGKFAKASYARAAAKCNCFVSGTPIDTPDGSVPIELIVQGDMVFTLPETAPSDPDFASTFTTDAAQAEWAAETVAAGPVRGVGPAHVSAVFRRIAPAVLWLTFANGVVLGTTPGHEVWTHQDGWGYAVDVEIGDTFLDRDGRPVAITKITLDPTPTAVYNFEVRGSFTYFVNGLWVHNNSCPIWRGKVNNAYGHSFETAVREMYGLPVYVGPKLKANGTNFVPDFLGDGIIGEIKGGKYVSMTPQLQAIADYAAQNGLTAVLYAAGDVAKPVRELFRVRSVP